MSFEHDALRSAVRDSLAKDADPWLRLCSEIGVTALSIPESFGGMQASLAESYLVLEELGRVLSPAPMLSSLLAAQALLHAGNDDACSRLLPDIASGAKVATVALSGITAIDGRLTGTASHVLDGDIADILLAVTPDGLFELSAATVTPLVPMDQTRHLATITLEAAPGVHLGPTSPTLNEIACIALAAEQVGAMERALELTVEYTKIRVQFGQTIASFQALQHRMADMHVLATTARSVYLAAAAGSVAASVAKVHCSEAFMQIAGEMIQLHGGIGITWEHDAHRYFKRAYGSAQLFGHPRDHVQALASRL